MREKYEPLFDEHGAETGTVVDFRNGAQVLSTDPQTYRKLEPGGYKLPRRIWPLFDGEGEQVTAVAGSRNGEAAA